MPTYASVPSLVRRCDVDPETVRRWAKRGFVKAKRLPTGHYRIEVDADGFPVFARALPKYGPAPKRRKA